MLNQSILEIFEGPIFVTSAAPMTLEQAISLAVELLTILLKGPLDKPFNV